MEESEGLNSKRKEAIREILEHKPLNFASVYAGVYQELPIANMCSIKEKSRYLHPDYYNFLPLTC